MNEMSAISHDRRVRRSNDNLELALSLLLDAQREQGSLEGITLASDDGLALATFGDHGELLAALSPQLARGTAMPVTDDLSHLLDAISVHAFVVDGAEFYLTLCGGDPSMHGALALRGMQGATRILRH
ncbi:MAG: hypothetical protein Q8Q09_05525 [Deltaproteobacteria bacterium]|nr:hypothetical protein [Deltaproteobacteria bacterium]